MAENVVPRRQYTKEFKVEAVRLAGRIQPVVATVDC